MSRYTLHELNPVADSARSLVDYFRGRFPPYTQMDSGSSTLQMRERSDSVGSVSDLRENFLLPQLQASAMEDLPYRTPYHQGWKKKTYNVFGHVMGQYKGALNPQAHGQNSFESSRTFHGGDNVVIETFAGADMDQNIDKLLFWNAMSASFLLFALQFYRYEAYWMYVEETPIWTMSLNLSFSFASLVVTYLQYRRLTRPLGLLVLFLAVVLLAVHSLTLLLDFKLLILWPFPLQATLTTRQERGFLHLICIHLISSVLMLPLFMFLRLALMQVQSMRNTVHSMTLKQPSVHQMHAF